jgi:hypothetical protein
MGVRVYPVVAPMLTRSAPAPRLAQIAFVHFEPHSFFESLQVSQRSSLAVTVLIYSRSNLPGSRMERTKSRIADLDVKIGRGRTIGVKTNAVVA